MHMRALVCEPRLQGLHDATILASCRKEHFESASPVNRPAHVDGGPCRRIICRTRKGGFRPFTLRKRCYCKHKLAHGSHTGAVRFCSRKCCDDCPDVPLTLLTQFHDHGSSTTSHRQKPFVSKATSLVKEGGARFQHSKNIKRNLHLICKSDLCHFA